MKISKPPLVPQSQSSIVKKTTTAVCPDVDETGNRAHDSETYPSVRPSLSARATIKIVITVALKKVSLLASKNFWEIAKIWPCVQGRSQPENVGLHDEDCYCK